jgi:hypothetical protein
MLLLLPRGVKNLAGQTFTELTPVKIIEISPTEGAIWDCDCSCGATRHVSARNLLAGRVTRCVACARKGRTLRLVNARLSRGDSESSYQRNWRSHLENLSPERRAIYDDYIERRERVGVQITDRIRAGAVEMAMIEKKVA